jgi:hypothetical protein
MVSGPESGSETILKGVEAWQAQLNPKHVKAFWLVDRWTAGMDEIKNDMT